MAAIARLRRRSLAFTVDLLGEATITEKEADESRDEYLDLIDGLSAEADAWPADPLIDRDDHGPLPRVNVSVKLSALYSQFDAIDPDGSARAVGERLRPILRAARRRRVFVNIDMEQYAVKDLTLYVFQKVLDEDEFRDWPDVGIAVQAYLRDTAGDLERLADWARRRGTPVWVRLVKGAYWDYETVMAGQLGWPTPVWTHKWETDAAYERLTDFLLENRAWLRPAFGSHNVRSLAHALATAELARRAAQRLRAANAVRYGGAGQGRAGRAGPAGPRLHALRRTIAGHGLSGSSLAGEHGQRIVPARQLHRTRSRGSTPPESGGPGEWEGGTKDMNDLATPQNLKIEPLTDFGRPDARRAMASALEEVGPAVRPHLPAGNRRQAGRRRRRPSTRTTPRTAGRSSAGAAPPRRNRPGRPSKPRRPPSQVGGTWNRAGGRSTFSTRPACCVRRRFELAAWQVYECGKPWREADADVAETIDYCEFYGREMLRLAAPRRRDAPGEENVYFYEPRGVAAVIAPWNFPMAILCGMATAALVTGNTVVLKPAEQSCVVGAKLMEVFEEIGLPPGVANFLPGVGEEVGPVLVEHPAVAVIAFTGSRAVGLNINREAAEPRPGQEQVKRVIAEMGGKNAVVVDDDADLDEAVHGVVASAFGYAGQKCSACSRVIVPAGLHDVFLARLVEATRSLKVAPAEDPGCTVGPVIDDEAQARILRTIEQGKSQGRLVYAGDVGALAQEGSFVAPHVFADVDPSASLATEEIFGPVLTVLRSDGFARSLEIANGTSYALTGGLYSRSPAHIEEAKRRFRVGNLYINRKITGALVDRQPFGGFKMSGVGSKAGGPDYLLQFVLPRTITENTLRRGFAPTENETPG